MAMVTANLLHGECVKHVELLDVDPTPWPGGRVVVVEHEHMHLHVRPNPIPIAAVETQALKPILFAAAAPAVHHRVVAAGVTVEVPRAHP